MPNNFGLFFSRDGAVIRLPVNPEKLPVAREMEGGSYNVLGIGPILTPRTPGLREVSISSFFPGRAYSGVLTPNEFRPPEFYIRFFEGAMNDEAPVLYTPVRYYEDGTPFFTGDEGFFVLVTQFRTEERGGETGDFYYDLTLSEYRDYAPRTVQIVQPAQQGQPAAVAAEPSRSIPQGQLVVGASCVANGPYYASSYGDEPHGTASGRTVVVSRMVDGSRAYPVHVTTESGGPLGWMKKDALQAVKSP